MEHPTFITWLEDRRQKQGPLVPEADKIIQRIILAGRGGLTYSQLISTSELDRPVIDALLDSLVQLRMVQATGAGLARRFRYCCRLV
jgi:hypothetical protein